MVQSKTSLSDIEAALFEGWLFRRQRAWTYPRRTQPLLIGGVILFVAHIAGLYLFGPEMVNNTHAVGITGLVLAAWGILDTVRARLHSPNDWWQPIPNYAMGKIAETCSTSTKEALETMRAATPDGVLRFTHLGYALRDHQGSDVQDLAIMQQGMLAN